jgi:aromatic-amino-acid transaminase
MCARSLSNRKLLASLNPALSAVVRQRGMFSLIQVTPEAVQRLKQEHAIYIAGSGRINVAGFRNDGEIERFAKALKQVQ